jgi:hypothetical protein
MLVNYQCNTKHSDQAFKDFYKSAIYGIFGHPSEILTLTAFFHLKPLKSMKKNLFS